MDFIMIVLDFFLGISYLASGIAAHFDWFDIALGISWSALGGANIYFTRKKKKRDAEFKAQMDKIEFEMNRLQ